MDNYILKKSEKEAKIVKLSKGLEGYNFKAKSSNGLNISDVIISKPDLVDKILTNNFKKKYKKLVMIVLSILHASDTTEGDCILALDEIARLKDILLFNYHKKLKAEKEALFLQQLDSLELQLHQKISQIRAFNQMFSFVPDEEEKHKGR